MQRFLDKLERRFHGVAIENLTLVLVGMQLAALVLSLARPAFAELLVLDPVLVQRGQVWRLITYLFLPPSFDPLWAVFGLYWLHTMGTALESQWGSFKYQLFWLTGAVFTTAGAFALGIPADNAYLLMSLFLAFATLWPDYEILLFFIIPVRVKWLAMIDALILLGAVGTATGWAAILPLLAVANYLLFFGEALVLLLRGKAVQAGRKSERTRFAAKASGVPDVRRCALCGITSTDDPKMDFRVCTCEKHDRPTELCITHARNH